MKASELEGEFATMNGWEAESDAANLLNGLGIETDLHYQYMKNLTGAQKVKVLLAQALFGNPDILLLDEPTNHLDLRATEWLEDYLQHFKGTVLLISHDRYFIDKIAQRCIDISDGKAEFYSGGYSFYVVERQKRFEEKLRKYEKDQAKIEQLTRAAEQMHLWAFMGNDKLHKRAFQWKSA